MEKIQDKSWTDTQDAEFVEALTTLHDQFMLSVRQNMLMVQLYNEYGYALGNVLNPAPATEDDIVSNTNLSEKPEPANRAERRAKGARKTPLDL